MRFKLVIGVALICAAAFALPAWPHHSHGNYEDTFMDIEGVVKEVHLVVPHSWIYMEVKEASRSEWTSALARLVRRAAATGALPLPVRSRRCRLAGCRP